MALIKSFGEKGDYKWYKVEGSDEKITCDEFHIDMFWNEWVMRAGARREKSDQDGEIVFEFKEAVEFDIKLWRL